MTVQQRFERLFFALDLIRVYGMGRGGAVTEKEKRVKYINIYIHKHKRGENESSFFCFKYLEDTPKGARARARGRKSTQ